MIALGCQWRRERDRERKATQHRRHSLNPDVVCPDHGHLEKTARLSRSGYYYQIDRSTGSKRSSGSGSGMLLMVENGKADPRRRGSHDVQLNRRRGSHEPDLHRRRGSHDQSIGSRRASHASSGSHGTPVNGVNGAIEGKIPGSRSSHGSLAKTAEQPSQRRASNTPLDVTSQEAPPHSQRLTSVVDSTSGHHIHSSHHCRQRNAGRRRSSDISEQQALSATLAVEHLSVTAATTPAAESAPIEETTVPPPTMNAALTPSSETSSIGQKGGCGLFHKLSKITGGQSCPKKAKPTNGERKHGHKEAKKR